MLTLKLLGEIELTDSHGETLDPLLRQPKHIALLAFLSMPRPGAWHRRDSIIATFWPDTDQPRARGALRTALFTLRNHLPVGVIQSRGDEELSVSPHAIQTDVATMSDDLDAGRFAGALARYRGELAPALFIPDSPAFEKWLDAERAHSSTLARRAASELSRQLEQHNDITGAIEAAHRAYDLDPDDEAAARRWIALLDRSGDRSQAFAVYERFRNHMSDAFGIRPSAETVALLDAIRTRREVSNVTVVAPIATRTGSPIERAMPRSRGRWIYALVPVALVMVAVLAFRANREPTPKQNSVAVAILPMRNETGDPNLDYLVAGIAEGVARQLQTFRGLTIHSAARADWSEASHDLAFIARETGSTILVQTALSKTADSLVILTSLVDTTNAVAQILSTHRFTSTDINDAENRIVVDVAAAVLRRPVPEIPRASDQRVNAGSYDLMLKGWFALLANAQISNMRPPREYKALDLFNQAVEIDPLNARAWSGISSVWAALAGSGAIPFEEGYEHSSAAALRAIAIDSLQGSAWANLGVFRALRDRDLTSGLKMIERGLAAEPSNAEIYLIKSNVLRAAHKYEEAREALRMAHALDPLSTVYLNQQANVEFCDDKSDAALRIFLVEVRSNPGNRVAANGTVRALALLRRYDEAAALWRREAESKGDSALAHSLALVHDSSRYWNLKHSQEEGNLSKLVADGGTGAVRMIQAQFAAGHPDLAYALMRKVPTSEKGPLYRLTCMPYVDEYKHTSRFKAEFAKIGSL